MEYKKEPYIEFKNPHEIELLAFKIGRLSNTYRVCGIDHKMGYNYQQIDSLARFQNNTLYSNFLIEFNADNLTHIATENGFEGVDEATKFYKRDL